jgi:hypothetical protein
MLLAKRTLSEGVSSQGTEELPSGRPWLPLPMESLWISKPTPHQVCLGAEVLMKKEPGPGADEEEGRGEEERCCCCCWAQLAWKEGPIWDRGSSRLCRARGRARARS